MMRKPFCDAKPNTRVVHHHHQRVKIVGAASLLASLSHLPSLPLKPSQPLLLPLPPHLGVRLLPWVRLVSHVACARKKIGIGSELWNAKEVARDWGRASVPRGRRGKESAAAGRRKSPHASPSSSAKSRLEADHGLLWTSGARDPRPRPRVLRKKKGSARDVSRRSRRLSVPFPRAALSSSRRSSRSSSERLTFLQLKLFSSVPLASSLALDHPPPQSIGRVEIAC